MSEDRPTLQLVVVGHVDHGKSTIVGRMLHDTGSLPEGKLDAVRAQCERNSKPFEYAFLIDALKEEQSQGITIDSARVFFSSHRRDYILIDAPGHVEFLKNMVTGASRADAGFLVIDAAEGIQENSRRHGYLLAMLGIKHFSVIVNKMDLIDYDQRIFRRIVRRYRRFLRSISVPAENTTFIPVSGIAGDNIAARSPRTPWYEGKTVLEQLDSFPGTIPSDQLPARMPVQGVYKFTAYGDTRRIIAGSIAGGTFSVGEEVVFYPSGKRSRIRSFEAFSAVAPETITAPHATGFCLEDQIYVTRGELATRGSDPPPTVSSRLKANIFWLGREEMTEGVEYTFKLGTMAHSVRLHRVIRVLSASNLKPSKRKRSVERHDVAEVELRFDGDIAFDEANVLPATGRFVIVSNYDICGGGIIQGSATDEDEWIRENVRLRNFAWQRSLIQPPERAERYGQKSRLIVLHGDNPAETTSLAHQLEQRLFNEGKLVYCLGAENVEHGVSADLQEVPMIREEHVRRLAEVAHLFLDAGIMLIVSGIKLTAADIDVLRVPVNPESMLIVQVGERQAKGIVNHLVLEGDSRESSIEKIKRALRKTGAIFSPY
ncbi:MAG: GTP-binding protein [Spirochaetota bacterium]